MSVNIKFPADPEDGMIFELIAGVFYKYDIGSNSWTRLKGVESLGLATPLINGLMSKEDYTKLQNLVVPPPQATIKGEECDTTFKSGTVALYSFDESVEISKNPKIMNRTPGGGTIDATRPWQLHQSTAGFDFRVPLGRIIQEVEDRNQFKKIQLQGDKGSKGLRGDAGQDNLDTGPVGVKGEIGLNAPFVGALTSEGIPFELAPGNNNRAVVDIAIEEVSPDENYLVATRANIGNPDACPALITPKKFSSPLVVAINTIEGGKLVKTQTVSSDSGDCSLICRICASSLHHINIDDIIGAVHDQFLVRVQQLKLEKETLVKAWLDTMISLFSEQKAALCCALENCRSRYRNERTRQYLETQRIQAALGDFKLELGGSTPRCEFDEAVTLDMDQDKDCPVEEPRYDPVEIEDGCLIITLDPKVHIGDPRAIPKQSVVAFLKAGDYIAEITGCCANFNSSVSNAAYSARAAILYQAATSIGSGALQENNIETSAILYPDFGTFSTLLGAKNAYQGLTMTFSHSGGEVSFWLLDPDGFAANNDGMVVIKVRPVPVEDVTIPEAVGFLYVYRDEISFDGLLGRITPYAGNITASENLGSLPNDVDLTVGPALIEDSAQIFFFDGEDGLSLFFVAGAQPSSNNNQIGSILADVSIQNNTFVTDVRAKDASADIKKISASEYQAALLINKNSSGFAIGEFDPTADFSIRVDPRDLSTMRTFVASSSAGEDILISQGGSEGIGGTISQNKINTAPLYEVDDVPTSFGGGNMVGLRVNNERSGQNVFFTRPVNIDLDSTFGGSGSGNTGASGSPRNPNSTTKVLKATDGDFPEIRASLVDEPTGPWSAFVRFSGRLGSSGFTVRQDGLPGRAIEGNPGAYRETTHSAKTGPTRLSITSRPTGAFFGPSSLPNIPWNLSYAQDQFGNVWLFVRDVTGSPTDNGAGDIFLRDATSSDFSLIPDKLAENVFTNGSSGLASGATAGPFVPGDGNAIITTFHITANNPYSPEANDSVNSISLTYSGQVFDIGNLRGFEVGIALTQSGNLYASSKVGFLPGPGDQGFTGDWLADRIVSASSQIQFGEVDSEGIIDTTSNPDFARGETINVGYYVRSTHTLPTIEQRSVGIDNVTFCLTVQDISTTAVKVQPTVDNVPKRIIDNKGDFVGEDDSTLARGAAGSPQDPCIIDICTSVRAAVPQSMRYILTDKDGNKFYSAVSTLNVRFLNQFQVFSFGSAVTMLAPPPEFTANMIASQNLDLALMSDQLSATQLTTAENLGGISRLTYVQSILGVSTNAIPNARSITNIEIELQNTPFSSIDFGFITAKVGLPGALTEILIDDFHADEITVGHTVAEPVRIQGSVKRTVATVDYKKEIAIHYGGENNIPFNGSTTSAVQTFSGFGSYFGDYTGSDITASGSTAFRNKRRITRGRGMFSGSPVDLNGNNFFLVNRRNGTLTQVTAARGFQDIEERIDPVAKSGGGSISSQPLRIIGANRQDIGNVAVSDFGVVYIADGPNGKVYAVVAGNAIIQNTTHGDANDNGNNYTITIAEGLPSTNNVAITLGKKNVKGSAPDPAGPAPPGDGGMNFYDEVLVNFGGQWYKFDGLPSIEWRRGAASRLDTTTPRCCFGGSAVSSTGFLGGGRRPIAAKPGKARTIENGGVVLMGTGIVPGFTTNIVTDKNANAQPSFPVPSDPSSRLFKSFPYSDITVSIQTQLDADFNQLNVYQLTDNIIYKIDQTTGASTVFRDLGENAFDLKANPRTKDLYYIANNGPSPHGQPTGSAIRYVDIDDLEDAFGVAGAGPPRIKTIIELDTDSLSDNHTATELFQGITFGNSVPSDLTTKNQVLYALLSTANGGAGNGSNTNDSPVSRVVEIAERVVPLNPSVPISASIPGNSRWSSYVTGGGVLGNPSRVIFSRLTPGGGCQMHYKQVQWYERGWRTGACCGALVEVNGVHYIVVKRSIGIDTSCGGGESLSTTCISQFIELDEGHPAIAWPTSDPDGDPFEGLPGGGGDEFLGLPTSGFVNFVKDEDLSNQILGAIRGVNSIRTIGKPATEIPFILFPAA